MAEGLRGPTAPIACPSDRRDRSACSWSPACRYCSFSSLLLVLTLSPFSSLSANLTATLHFVRDISWKGYFTNNFSIDDLPLPDHKIGMCLISFGDRNVSH